jgi:hypothetical protein
MPTKTTKKTAAKKKTTARKMVKPVVQPAPVIDIPEPSRYCHCTKRKRNTILTCVSTSCFLLGILVCHFFLCPCHQHNKPHIDFVNGCADIASIKCPEMLKKLPAIDADHNNCITKAELRAAKKMMRHHKRPAPVEQPAVVDAIAPVME